MKIFNRYGDLIFEQFNSLPNTLAGWDGTFNGKTLNPDVFVYLIELEFIDGRKKVLSGDVLLIK